MSQLKLDYIRGDVLAGKYEVIDLLDKSPLGYSYRVKHMSSGKYVRLLLLDPAVAGKDRKDAIIEAVKAAREIKHRNLLKVGELYQHAGVAYVTMEDFDGKSLRELIQEYKVAGRQFSLREAAQITIQILEACRAVHGKGHAFRALRPEYVQVNLKHTGPRGQNVVADVRVAGAGLWNLVPSGSLAEDEFTRGEAQYISPELKGVDPQPTGRSDVYSVGVMFYELMTGVAPVGTFQLPRQKRPDLPAHIDDIVQLALAMAPEDRYPSAGDFAADIKRTFTGAAEEVEHVSGGIQPVVVGLALAMLAGIGLLLWSSSGDPFKEAVAADSLQRKEILESHPIPPPEEIRAILDRHPKNMIYVPPGPYISGKLRQEKHTSDLDDSEPTAEVITLEAFLVDAFEYPNLKGAPPKYGVPYGEAERLCKEQGKRLCTGDEFEKACKGPQNYVYGYGDTFDRDYCGMGFDDVHAAGELGDCKSGWGVYDIAGNLREWTSTARGDTRRIVKGGLQTSPQRGSRCAFGTDESVTFADNTLSFRCCRDLNAPPIEAADGEAEK